MREVDEASLEVLLLLNIKFGIYIMWVAVILTFISGMDYLLKNKKLISQK